MTLLLLAGWSVLWFAIAFTLGYTLASGAAEQREIWEAIGRAGELAESRLLFEGDEPFADTDDDRL